MNISSRLPRRGAFLAAILALCVAGQGWTQTTGSTTASPAPLVAYPIGDSLVFLGSAGLVVGSHFIEKHKPKPDLAALSPADIPPFDRLYTTHRSEPLSLASDATLIGTVLLPAVMIPSLNKSELVASGVVYAEALAVSYGLKSIIKAFVVRYRPYAYAPNPSPAVLADPELESSFPSGHVTVAFAAAVAGGYLFSLYNTNPAQRAGMWAAELSLASATAVFRVWSGNHFPSDVVAAAGIGSLVGVLLPFVHSPSSLAATGLVPAANAVSARQGVPIVQWRIALP